MNEYNICIINDHPGLLNSLGDLMQKRFTKVLKLQPERHDSAFLSVMEPLINLSVHPRSMPDIALVDMDFYGEEDAGIKLARRLDEEYPHLPIIFVTGYYAPYLLSAALKISTVKGYFRYISEQNQGEELLNAVNSILNFNTYYFNKEVFEGLIDHYRKLLKIAE